MHQETLKEIERELKALLPGRFLGKLFQLSTLSLAIDFGLQDKSFLFISIEPAAPRLYLIKRTVRELEKSSGQLNAFAQTMRTILGGNTVVSLAKDENERVFRFNFRAAADSNDSQLVAQLTGRSANMYLLNSSGDITHAWRPPQGDGQQIGEAYRPPKPQAKTSSTPTDSLIQVPPGASSISETIDTYYRGLEREQRFQELASKVANKLRLEITKRKKLITNLQSDLKMHGEPETHKRAGDLLLANIATAQRSGNKVRLIDYFADDAPTIEIEVDENDTLQEAATESFSRYTKAKRAVEEIGNRLSRIHQELEELLQRKLRLEEAIANRDATALAEFEERKAAPAARRKKEKASQTLPGMRRYLSSDGYEVLVGRTARDNDQLTFRLARPHDLWLHAGDYPGSHVIVRNSGRKEVPHRTIVEAAQLAAKFSQASKDSKVSIHYTQRKFLSKPKGAASGLVRLSTFKTITVEPGENLERVK